MFDYLIRNVQILDGSGLFRRRRSLRRKDRRRGRAPRRGGCPHR